MTEKFKVTGMSCAACSARVERAVGSLPEVESCSVNLLTADMTVVGDVDRERVIAAVEDAGYGIVREAAPDMAKTDEKNHTDTVILRRRLLFSVGFSLILMYFSMGRMLGIPMLPIVDKLPVLNGIIQMLLALTVMVINRKFFINGIKGVIHGAPNMDTLVSLGSLASFGYSIAMLVLMCREAAEGGTGEHYLHEFYFESAAMILALITIGKLLEARAKGKTTDAIKGLVSLKGKNATVLRGTDEIVISVDDVVVGDVLVIRPGESIPTDAIIVSGEASIDESMLTGESLPRDVSAGDSVYGGTLNTSGFLTARATSVGEGTVLASIINMVKEASGSKAPIAKLADRVSAIFVPVVMGISVLTFIGWMIASADVGYAIARAISVLVISCPCALGLATPVAIMVGSGVGARHGVLYKNAAALEECGRIKTVVLDKTGTVTEGKPRVTDVLPVGIGHDELLTLAYSLEAGSEHPLASAVVKYAEENGISPMPCESFRSEGGRGVYAKIGGIDAYGTSYSYATRLADTSSVGEAYERFSDEGKSQMVFIRGGICVGIIAVADAIKSDARESIGLMKSMGLEVVMLSGDNERTARRVADAVGIDRVIAGVMPDGKEAVIRELMQGGKVCMVGDGINDAPALTRADVGIAIGCGTDIAIDSADVVVMGSGLAEVVNAIGIGRSTLSNIRQNLFWAFIYNCLGIPLAAGLFGLSMSPMIGAAMMSMSSVCVVFNALRLNLWRNKKAHKVATVQKNDSIFGENTAEPIMNEALSSTSSETVANLETENENMTKTIKVSGMMCPHCEARVKKVCEAIDGVILATPSHTDGTVVLEMSKDLTEECIAAIIDAGYEA